MLDDVLSTRLAFRLSQRAGIVENRCAGKQDGPGIVVCDESGSTVVPSGLPERLNDIDNWAARGQLRLQPPDTDMDWLLNLHGGKVDQQQTVGLVTLEDVLEELVGDIETELSQLLTMKESGGSL